MWIFVVLANGLTPSLAGNGPISEEKAIQLATVEATRLGYDVKAMDVSVEKNEGPLNACIGEQATGKYIEARKQRLAGKEYYTVAFDPKNVELGGFICVYVNRHSGEIITTYRGR